LITQAQADGEGNSDSDFCKTLHDSLVNKPPSTCNSVRGSWGTIAVRCEFPTPLFSFPELTLDSFGRSTEGRSKSMPPYHRSRLRYISR
jgi:hypothetical protein